MSVLTAATVGLPTVYEKGLSDSDCEAHATGLGKTVSSDPDDACIDSPEWTHASGREAIDSPFARELLKVFEDKLQAHRDDLQSLLEQRCAACDQRLERLEGLHRERCNDIAEALLSESDRWRSFSQKLEEELGAGTNRLYGVEHKLWKLEHRFQETRGAQLQTSEASIPTASNSLERMQDVSSNSLERMQEHIESNSEFVRSFIERESAKISSLSERLLRSDDERLALERKLDDVARFVEDVRKDNLATDPTVASQPLTRASASTSCLTVPSGAGDDLQSGRRQRPPVTRTASARAGDLLAAERVRRLQSAPVLAPLGSARSAQNALLSQATRSSVAEKCRSPEKPDGQKVNNQRTPAARLPASTVGAQSPTSMKRRVSPKPGF